MRALEPIVLTVLGFQLSMHVNGQLAKAAVPSINNNNNNNNSKCDDNDDGTNSSNSIRDSDILQ